MALSLVLAAALTSCGNTSTSPSTNAPAATDTATADTAATAQTEAVKPMNYALFTQKVATVSGGKLQYINKQPIVIDFYATWCPPCKQLKPILDAVATSFAGEVAVYKVDVDQEPELAALFNIQSIPTLLYVSADGQAEAIPGFANEKQLRQNFDALILKGLKVEGIKAL